MALEGPRALIIIFVIFFFFMSPDTRRSSISQQRDSAAHVLQERADLELLSTTDYNNLDVHNARFLNLTGFRNGDGYAFHLLPEIQKRAREQYEVVMKDHLRSRRDNGTVNTLSHKTLEELQYSEVEEMLNFETIGEPPFYRNITSIIQGRWARSLSGTNQLDSDFNLSALAPGVEWVTHKFNRNISGWEGDLRFKLREEGAIDSNNDSSNSIREIKAEMVIQDETSNGDGWDAVLFGVHLVQQGSIVLTTTSEKFAGIFALPHMMLSPDAFRLTQGFLAPKINETIKEQQDSFGAVMNPWTSSPHNPTDSIAPVPHCEYIIYLQQHPSAEPVPSFRDLENELRYPTGASLSAVPPIKMSALIFSPDCGFLLESKGPPHFAPGEGSHLVGKKIEAYLRTAKDFALTVAFLVCAELYLLKGQMNEASTPSTKSRISFYTVTMMALGDGFGCISLLVVGMLVDGLFLTLHATAFLSFLCVSFFGMKFLMDVWTVQAPERQERERERLRQISGRNTNDGSNQAPSSNENINAALNQGEPEPGTLPLPATARRPESNSGPTQIILPPDQDLDVAEAEDAAMGTTNPNQPAPTTLGSARREIGALYSRFYFFLLTIFLLSVHSTSWPPTARTIYCDLLSFIYLSFWTPQIHRNIIRNCRKALSWRFVIGQSILRLCPFIYFYTWSDNVLFVRTDSNLTLFLCAWVWLQVFVLGTQEAVGPRFFVPEGWAPPAYDYHPILREGGDGESGSNMPIGFSEAVNNDASSPTFPVAATSSSSAAETAPRKRSSDKHRGGRNAGDHHRTFDCAICTETFDVPVVPAAKDGEGVDEASSTGVSATTIFARRAYMVTPCRHIFHSACLEGWMRYRLQCPICREGLPAL